jgi:hypothetical protein
MLVDENVRVKIARDADAGVAHRLADDGQRHTSLMCNRCVAVAQVVEAIQGGASYGRPGARTGARVHSGSIVRHRAA